MKCVTFCSVPRSAIAKLQLSTKLSTCSNKARGSWEEKIRLYECWKLLQYSFALLVWVIFLRSVFPWHMHAVIEKYLLGLTLTSFLSSITEDTKEIIPKWCVKYEIIIILVPEDGLLVVDRGPSTTCWLWRYSRTWMSQFSFAQFPSPCSGASVVYDFHPTSNLYSITKPWYTQYPVLTHNLSYIYPEGEHANGIMTSLRHANPRGQ